MHPNTKPEPTATEPAQKPEPKKPERTKPRPTDAASRAKWKHERAVALGDKKPAPKA
jgi:hypothetical protein